MSVYREYVRLSSVEKTRWKNIVLEYYATTLHPQVTIVDDTNEKTFELMWAILHLQQGTRKGNLSTIMSQYRRLSEDSQDEWIKRVDECISKNIHPVLTDSWMQRIPAVEHHWKCNQACAIWAQLHLKQGTRQAPYRTIVSEFEALGERFKVDWKEKLEVYFKREGQLRS